MPLASCPPPPPPPKKNNNPWPTCCMNHEVPENPFQMKLEAPFLLTQCSEKPTVFYSKKLYAVIASLEVEHNHQHTIPTGNSKTELFLFFCSFHSLDSSTSQNSQHAFSHKLIISFHNHTENGPSMQKSFNTFAQLQHTENHTEVGFWIKSQFHSRWCPPPPPPPPPCKQPN